MQQLFCKVLLACYQIALIALTISSLIIGIGIYSKNRDVANIDFRKFNKDPDSRYPTFTMCFGGPLRDNNFQKFNNPSINSTTYIEFLKGNLWNDVMATIPYDDVSINIENHINSISVFEEKWEGKAYVSFRSAIMKCFSVNIPSPETYPLENTSVKYLRINLNASIFRNGIRPKGNIGYLNEDSFGVQLHYPGQRMKAAMQNWRWHRSCNPPIMEFKLYTMSVLQRRNKPNEPCNELSYTFDQTMLDNLIHKIGCKPLYVESKIETRICWSTAQMKDWYRPFRSYALIRDENIKTVRPCRVIKSIGYTYREESCDDNKINGNQSIAIMVRFRDMTSFKETLHVRAYNIDSLIGNVGGYFGLYLGFSFFDIPRLLSNCLEKIKSLKNVKNSL